MYGAKKAPTFFLYLSTDASITSWLNKSKDLKIPDDKSFIVLQNERTQNFVINIPRNMIIGNKGEMIDPDALRPGGPKLKLELDRLLIK